jgi:hypothetical protein
MLQVTAALMIPAPPHTAGAGAGAGAGASAGSASAVIFVEAIYATLFLLVSEHSTVEHAFRQRAPYIPDEVG